MNARKLAEGHAEGNKKTSYKKESELQSKVMMAAVLLNVESELLSALNLTLRDFFGLILEGEAE